MRVAIGQGTDRQQDVTRAPAEPQGSGRFSLWQAATAAPEMVGSLLLLLVLFGWLGAWEGLVLLVWLTAGGLALTRRGERCAVRASCGFRRPTDRQTALLTTAWAIALASYQLSPADVDLYVQRSSQPNACAAGGRSIAVTTGVLDEVVARRIGTGELAAVLAHELGHHAAGGTRLGLAALWLAAPWRTAAHLARALARPLARRQPRTPLVLIAVVGITVAVGQLITAGLWTPALVLSGTATAAVLSPLAEALISRRSEHAADQCAAAAGHGPALAAALNTLDNTRPPTRRISVPGRLLARHPATATRIEQLIRKTG